MKEIGDLDFNLLKALDALLDERNVTRAASRLGVSQPAMSSMLTRLREAIDDPLFVRSRYGIVATERAENLAVPLKRIISDISALVEPVSFDPKSSSLVVRIAATDYAQHTLLIPFLLSLKKHVPLIKIALTSVTEGNFVHALENGDLDFALVTTDLVPDGLHMVSLFQESYVCGMRLHHPASEGELTIEKFCSLDHALVSYSGGCFHGVTDDVLKKQNLRRNVVLSVNNFLVIPEIIRNSDLVAVAPSRMLVGQEGIVTFNPPLAIPGFTKVLAWHGRTNFDPAKIWIRDFLVRCCA